jgi:hypothetical protein
MWYAARGCYEAIQEDVTDDRRDHRDSNLTRVKTYLIAQSKPLFTPAPDRANPAVSKLK